MKILRWYLPRPYEEMIGFTTPVLDWIVASVVTFIVYGPLLEEVYRLLNTTGIVLLLATSPLFLWLAVKGFRWICRTEVCLLEDSIVQYSGKTRFPGARYADIRGCRVERKEFNGEGFVLVTLDLRGEGSGFSIPLRQTAMPLTGDWRTLVETLRGAGVVVTSMME